MRNTLLWGIAALLLACLCSLLAGAQLWSVPHLAEVMAGSGDATDALILRHIRLPRTIFAALVGAALAISGAALQGLLRNPLADPGVTGVSASAALGAVIIIYAGLATAWPWLVPVAALLFAALALILVMLLSGRNASATAVVLAGAAVASLAGALTALVMNLARTPYLISDLTSWLLGSLVNRGMNDVLLLLPFVLAGTVLILSTGRDLDRLALGEDSARTLGVNLSRLKTKTLLGAAMATGAAVALTGTIGFVGLVIPHLLRAATGALPSRLLVPSALFGAVFLIAADLLVRLWPGAQELKIGVVTAIIGAPFFIARILMLRGEDQP